MKKYSFLIFLILLGCSQKTGPVDLKVERLKLDNGLTVLLAKRQGAPIFASNIRFKVGSIEEEEGSSGLAHFFEHMAFKGTPLIGSKDYAKEKEVLKKIHATGTQIVKLKSDASQTQKVKELQTQLAKLQAQHAELVEDNEFIRIYQRNGGANINASTSADFTNYYVALPSDKLELWAYLESERLKNPVMREFFKERDVVAEERRMRYENNAAGKTYETFILNSFDKSLYGKPVIGYPDEIQNYTPAVAEAFRERYYIPSRMVISLVGNFDIKKAKKYIHHYFGPIPAKDDPSIQFVSEDLKKNFPRLKTISARDKPRVYVGFHRPAHPHPDDEVFDVLQELLCSGRTSRLFKGLVTEKKLATQIGCYGSLPGARLDGVFTFYGFPLSPHSNQELLDGLVGLLDSFKKELVSAKELQKVQNRIYADLIWSLKSNQGLANMLTHFEALTGDWEYLLRLQDKIKKVTPQDVQRVATQYFVPERRSTVFLEMGE